jgi:hypothetical protein
MYLVFIVRVIVEDQIEGKNRRHTLWKNCLAAYPFVKGGVPPDGLGRPDLYEKEAAQVE